MNIAALARSLKVTGVSSALGRLPVWSGVMGLNYHRIGDGTESVFDRGLWSATAEAFDAQIEFLKSRCDIISPNDLGEILGQGRKRGRYVLLSFDDGYLDNFEVAFPILKSHQVPATFFVSTGFLDSGRLPWWDEIAWMVRTSTRSCVQADPWLREPVVLDNPDRERAVRTLLKAYKIMPAESNEDYLEALASATGTGRYASSFQPGSIAMTWDMVREMRDAGMTIGGHTIHHPILARMPREAQWQEIWGCGQRLQTELGEPMLFFSYPVGGLSAFNEDTRDCLDKAGVRYAFSYYGGYRTFGEWDDYDIRRIAIESNITADWFEAIFAMPQLFGRARS